MRLILDYRALIVFASLIIVFASGCGGGSGSHFVAAPTVPSFASAPVISASEATAYAYTLAATDPAGGTVTFQLTAAPTGAQLSGNTVTWTPGADQSRIPNEFAVKASTSSGGSATQSWTVTPTGTVHVSWVDNYWDENGFTPVDHIFASGRLVNAAIVPQPDGTFVTLPGSADADGHLVIANVPAGYFWLRLSPLGTYWTSSSHFDWGTDYVGWPSLPTIPGSLNSNFQFSFDGLDPLPTASRIEVTTPLTSFFGSTLPGSTTYTIFGGIGATNNVDLTSVKRAYVLQYRSAAFGPIAGSALDSSLAITDVSWTNGGTNTLTGTLVPSPIKTLPLSINGSAWVPLFDRVAPTSPTPIGTPFELDVRPVFTLTNGLATRGPSFSLFSPDLTLGSLSGSFVLPPLTLGSCGIRSATSSFSIPEPPVILTDQDMGTVQYGDPFPASWARNFMVCQEASTEIAVPGSSATQTFVLTNGHFSDVPASPVRPLIGPAQNPKINGVDMLTAGTIGSQSPTLTWTAPALGTPYGYEVQIYRELTRADGTLVWVNGETFSTAKTSMTIPPGILGSGHSYLFAITALADGHAVMESSPRRHALPAGNADLISAPITVSGSATP